MGFAAGNLGTYGAVSRARKVGTILQLHAIRQRYDRIKRLQYGYVECISTKLGSWIIPGEGAAKVAQYVLGEHQSHGKDTPPHTVVTNPGNSSRIVRGTGLKALSYELELHGVHMPTW